MHQSDVLKLTPVKQISSIYFFTSLLIFTDF